MLRPEFVPFKKIPRLSRECCITEKIDGTNASVYITDDGDVFAASRNRWITVQGDNYGFAAWVEAHRQELLALGPGHHFGEWWGLGIQRGYNIFERRFSLFNTAKWGDDSIRPACCHVVPVLYQGEFGTLIADTCLMDLKDSGSIAAPGFMRPEGIVVYHTAANSYFKKTIEKDEERKGVANA